MLSHFMQESLCTELIKLMDIRKAHTKRNHCFTLRKEPQTQISLEAEGLEKSIISVASFWGSPGLPDAQVQGADGLGLMRSYPL